MGGAPTIAALFAQRVVISVGDMAVSNTPQVVLSTYALGSCIAAVAYDPAVKATGILHLMLPDSTISPGKAVAQPAMFADTGLPALLRAMIGLRADRTRLRLLLTGGASVIGGTDPFRIGERNSQTTLDWLRRERLRVAHTDIGGSLNRTVHIEVNTGQVTLKLPNGTTQHSLA